jgi:hypothetical protein
MSAVRNIKKIKDLLSKEEFERLNAGAEMHLKQSRIEFKVLDSTDSEITVRVLQGESPAENHLSSKQFAHAGKDFFRYFFPDKRIHTRPIPFSEFKTDAKGRE